MQYEAEFIEFIDETYTENYRVFGIYLGEGNPEENGSHWSFTRAYENNKLDKDGVCVVKEIQQLTEYNCISSFELIRDKISCKFDKNNKKLSEIGKLEITFEIDNNDWIQLQKMLKIIFEDFDNFKIIT